MSPALARRRALQELIARPELRAATDERFQVLVLRQAAYTNAVRSLQEWQQRLHELTCRACLGLAGEDE